jgi:hypothetical protein
MAKGGLHKGAHELLQPLLTLRVHLDSVGYLGVNDPFPAARSVVGLRELVLYSIAKYQIASDLHLPAIQENRVEL